MPVRRLVGALPGAEPGMLLERVDDLVEQRLGARGRGRARPARATPSARRSGRVELLANLESCAAMTRASSWIVADVVDAGARSPPTPAGRCPARCCRRAADPRGRAGRPSPSPTAIDPRNNSVRTTRRHELAQRRPVPREPRPLLLHLRGLPRELSLVEPVDGGRIAHRANRVLRSVECAIPVLFDLAGALALHRSCAPARGAGVIRSGSRCGCRPAPPSARSRG